MANSRITFMLAACVLLVATGSDLSAQLLTLRKRTRPCPRPGIPRAQYQVNMDSATVTAVSKRAILVDRLEADVEEELEDKGLIDSNAIGDGVTVQDTNLRSPNQPAGDQDSETTRSETAGSNVPASASLSARDRFGIGLRQAMTTLGDRETILSSLRSGNLQNPSARRILSDRFSGSEALPAAERSLFGLPDTVSDLRTSIRNQPVGTTDAVGRMRTKLFQFTKVLSVDHCEISQMAVEVESTGRWNLSLLATQNSNEQSNRRTQFLRQNEFVVQLRFYGEFRNEPLSHASLLGRPALAQVEAVEFYVRNGQPYYLSISRPDNLAINATERNQRTTDRREPRILDRNASLLLRRYFEQIDRVAISFFYRGGSALPLSRSALMSE